MVNHIKIHITGIVQGVGFRPFIYNLAHKYNLKGFCLNDSHGLLIEVQGEMIDTFIQEIKACPPPLSRIEEFTVHTVHSKKIYKDFIIRKSLSCEGGFTLISPDIATCQDCLRELFDPNDRRYCYPFINCTNCGPRYSIIEDVPYDRFRTTMAPFRMCTVCEREYHDTTNRRFHAQPNACSKCGPKVWLERGRQKIEGRDTDNYKSQNHTSEILTNFDAIQKSIALLKSGAILAIKGLGGFHLVCDAVNHDAVKRLRERKRRSNKPFALMAPNSKVIKSFCSVSEKEGEILEGRIRPIVILKKDLSSTISEEVAPYSKNLGVMLPYTPLHHLLFGSEEIKFIALVMTSGNQSEEPIVISNDDALERLSSIADFFLLHDRGISMRIDDSVVREKKPGEIANVSIEIPHGKSETQKLKSQTLVIRRARGFVPEPIDPGEELEEILAFGAGLKSTFCLTKGKKAILSQHIGDLQNYDTLEFFKESLKNLKNSFRISPQILAHDLHPDYLSTRFALEYATQINIPHTRIIPVQHHHAHIVSCMAEHHLNQEVIGVAFDGTGYGLDGNIWGGEFLIVNKGNFIRKAHFEYIPMPGSDKAIKEPWRMATAYLYHIFGDRMFETIPSFFKRFSTRDIDIIATMIKKRLHCPLTSSVGRLFDALSSLLRIRDRITFEGEAAIELEMMADCCDEKELRSYPFQIICGKPRSIDLKPLIKSCIEDLNSGIEASLISFNFHYTLAKIVVKISNILREEHGIRDVVLSGGVFQNKLLSDLTEGCLRKEGFIVWSHEQIPANDGGISLGQAIVAWEKLKR
ncbi:MAG: carbamoyltransferase HypF [Candidatus Jettenia caeni]|nr:MAG: carbamoyltransferase HypF [Candidatus Jettenia caeni]